MSDERVYVWLRIPMYGCAHTCVLVGECATLYTGVYAYIINVLVLHV